MSEPTDVEELGAANLPAEEAAQLKAKLERIQNTSTRLAQMYFEAEAARAAAPPTPLDLAPLWAAACQATGLTIDELKALSAANDNAPEPEPRPMVDKRRDVRRRMKAAGVPERFIRDLADKEPIDCPALDRVRQLHAADHGIVVLTGGIGTRKTGSACWLLGQREGGAYLEAHELLAIAFDDRARYLKIAHASAVVLDEIKLAYLDEKGHWRRVFCDLFNSWYASCARVVITCNLDREQFKLIADERTVSRIRECGDFFRVEGSDVRGKK